MTEEFASLCSLHLSGPSPNQEPPLHSTLYLGLCSPWPAFPWEDTARALCPIAQGYLVFHRPAWLSHTKSDPTCQSFEHSSLYHNQFRIPKVILGSCPQNTKINTCSNTLISSVSSGVGQVHISGYGLFYKALELGMAFIVLKRYGNKGVWQRPGIAKA